MKRFWLAMALWLALILAMSFHVFRGMWHEVLGLSMAMIALWHVGINLSFFKGFLRGRWSLVRVLTSALGVLLVASFVVATVTGVIISAHVFKSFWGGSALHKAVVIHQLHIASAYMMLILTGMHIGMHWRGLWARLTGLVSPLKFFDRHAEIRFWAVVVTGWAGILISRLDHVGDRLLLRHVFGTAAQHLPDPLYILLLFAFTGLYGALFFWALKLLNRRRKGAGA